MMSATAALEPLDHDFPCLPESPEHTFGQSDSAHVYDSRARMAFEALHTGQIPGLADLQWIDGPLWRTDKMEFKRRLSDNLLLKVMHDGTDPIELQNIVNTIMLQTPILRTIQSTGDKSANMRAPDFLRIQFEDGDIIEYEWSGYPTTARQVYRVQCHLVNRAKGMIRRMYDKVFKFHGEPWRAVREHTVYQFFRRLGEQLGSDFSVPTGSSCMVSKNFSVVAMDPIERASVPLEQLLDSFAHIAVAGRAYSGEMYKQFGEAQKLYAMRDERTEVAIRDADYLQCRFNDFVIRSSSGKPAPQDAMDRYMKDIGKPLSKNMYFITNDGSGRNVIGKYVIDMEGASFGSIVLDVAAKVSGPHQVMDESHIPHYVRSLNAYNELYDADNPIALHKVMNLLPVAKAHWCMRQLSSYAKRAKSIGLTRDEVERARDTAEEVFQLPIAQGLNPLAGQILTMKADAERALHNVQEPSRRIYVPAP